jgi:hypothetical protein
MIWALQLFIILKRFSSFSSYRIIISVQIVYFLSWLVNCLENVTYLCREWVIWAKRERILMMIRTSKNSEWKSSIQETEISRKLISQFHTKNANDRWEFFPLRSANCNYWVTFSPLSTLLLIKLWMKMTLYWVTFVNKLSN